MESREKRADKEEEEDEEEEARGVKNVRRRDQDRGGKIQYIFNLADVIRLCVCQERRIS